MYFFMLILLYFYLSNIFNARLLLVTGNLYSADEDVSGCRVPGQRTEVVLCAGLQVWRNGFVDLKAWRRVLKAER